MEDLPLCLDIIELIIDVLAKRRDIDMLAAFSLVSRFTRTISQAHIFKVVDLQSCTDPFKQQHRSELLYNLLQRRPGLGRHVKEIRLGDCRIPPNRNTSNRNLYSSTHDAKRAENRLLLISQMESGCYASLLSSLPNICGFRFIAKHQNKLDWAGDFPESLQEAIINIMLKPELTAFSIAGISGFPQSLLLDLTQIQVLEIWDTTFDFPALKIGFPTSDLFLKHLVLASGDRLDDGFDNLIYNFMERSAETLEHVTWMMDEHKDPATVDFRFLKRLRSLCLQVTTIGPRGVVPRIFHQLSLAQSNSLEYVTFSIKNFGISMFNDLEEEDVKDRWRVIDSILSGPSFRGLRHIKILAMDWPFFGQHTEVFHGLCERKVKICIESQ